jgi:hypothetical protein
VATAYEDQLMLASGVKGVVSTLVNGKGNVRTGMTIEIKHYPNNDSIDEGTKGRFTIGGFWELRSFGRCANRGRQTTAKTNSLDNAFLLNQVGVR